MRRIAAVCLALANVPLAAAAAQQIIDVRGSFPHPAANTAFPERIGEFYRSHALRYDAEGLDLSANYQLIRGEDRLLLLSVYIFPAGTTSPSDRSEACRREFEQTEQSLVAQHPGAERIEHGEAAQINDTEPGLGHRSVFRFSTRFGREVQQVRSEVRLYCNVRRQWHVKYRITAPLAVQADDAVDAFIRQSPWPNRAPPPAPDETVARASRDADAP